MLPNLQSPEFALELPSTGETVFYRPFLVKEEKMLLLALESANLVEITNSIMKIIASCVRSENTHIDDMTYFDVEFLFLNIRAKSVDNTVKLRLKHGNNTDCEHVEEYTLNIDDVQVARRNNHNKKIMLTDDVGVVMKYPTVREQDKIEDDISSTNVEKIFIAIANSIENVFDNDNVYEDATFEEKVTFVENLNKEQFNKITDFFNTMPAVEHEINYTCSECGKDEVVLMRGMQSFFA